jgi:hypothetical protein
MGSCSLDKAGKGSAEDLCSCDLDLKALTGVQGAGEVTQVSGRGGCGLQSGNLDREGGIWSNWLV